MRMRSLERNAREYMSISCTFASNNACRHLARSYGYRGVKDAHVERRTRIYIYICLLAFSVYTLRMYISAINTPNRFVNLGRWKVGMERGGGKESPRKPLQVPSDLCSYRRMALIGIRLGSLSCSPLFRPVRAAPVLGTATSGHFAFPWLLFRDCGHFSPRLFLPSPPHLFILVKLPLPLSLFLSIYLSQFPSLSKPCNRLHGITYRCSSEARTPFPLMHARICNTERMV